MRWITGALLLLTLIGMTDQAGADCRIVDGVPQSTTYVEGQLKDDVCDTHGQKPVTIEENNVSYGGEDLAATGGGSTNGVIVTEQRYLISDTVTADTQILGVPGYVKDINCIGTDAAATAGTIILRDALTETTPIVFTYNVPAVALTASVLTFPIEHVMATGIYLGYTTTNDVACYVRFR